VLLTRTLTSSTFRLALLCIAIFSGTVFALLGYVYWATTDYVNGRCDHAILADRAFLVEAYEKAGRDALVSLIEQRNVRRGFADGIYLLLDSSSVVLAGNLKNWPPALAGVKGWADFAAPEAAGHPLLRASYETLSDGSRLLVGQSLDDLNRFVGVIKTAVIFGAALTFVLAAVAGIGVTRRTVGRIEAINTTTREIMRSGLRSRIPLRGTRDEWDQLAENLNTMLDRIEELMREIGQVSDNVAHDLRTPLTRLRGRLEKAAHDEPDRERYHTLIVDATRELDAVLATFSSLLRISRIEALDPRGAFGVVDLAQVAGEVAELFDAAAEERGGHVTVESAGRVPVFGDRDLLFEAISNLLDNAIKHGGPGDVQVTVRNDAHGPSIAVADRGPGIPREERPHVFKRFYRIERSRSTPGSGLGLSFVAVVARLHRAHIEMEDNSPGLRIQLCFSAPDGPSGAPRPLQLRRTDASDPS
jgi:signal transduction histidine kinase